MSAPAGFDQQKQEEFLAEIRQGARPGAAAALLGFDRREVLRFIDSDPEFADQVAYAEIEATELVEEALFQAAVSGNVSASKVWLEMKGKMPQGPNQNRSDQPTPPTGRGDPFADLDNVEPLEPRLRNR